MGSYTTAASAFETVIGRYNSDYTPASTTGWDASDRLFVVGNGTSPSVYDKSDALIIYKNGNTDLFGNLSINNSSDIANTFSTSSGQAVDISYNLPTTQGATNSYLKNDASGSLSWVTIAGANPAWELTGNSGTNPATNFIGTTDAQDLSIRTSSAERIRIAADGNINIYGNTALIRSGGTANELRLNTSDNSYYTAFKSGTQTYNIVYTLPDTIGHADDLLSIGTDGKLKWQPLDASEFKQTLDLYIRVIRKPADEAVSNSTTLQPDDYIFFDYEANEKWSFDGSLIAVSEASQPGFKFLFGVSTGCNVTVSFYSASSSGNLKSGLMNQSTTAPEEIDLTSNQPSVIFFKGFLESGTSAGTMQLYWAQQKANSTPTYVTTDSFIKIVKVTEE